MQHGARRRLLKPNISSWVCFVVLPLCFVNSSLWFHYTLSGSGYSVLIRAAVLSDPVQTWYQHLSQVITSQLESSKFRCEHTRDTLRTHPRSDHSDHVPRCTRTHMATFNHRCVLGHSDGPPTQLTSSDML